MKFILKSGHWPRWRCVLKTFLFIFIILSSGCHFVQRSKTMLAIVVEGLARNTSVIFF